MLHLGLFLFGGAAILEAIEIRLQLFDDDSNFIRVQQRHLLVVANDLFALHRGKRSSEDVAVQLFSDCKELLERGLVIILGEVRFDHVVLCHIHCPMENMARRIWQGEYVALERSAAFAVVAVINCVR